MGVGVGSGDPREISAVVNLMRVTEENSSQIAPCVWWRRVGVGYCVPAAAAWLLDAHIGSYSALTAHKHSCRYRR